MSDPYKEGDAAARARRIRNLAIGGALVAFVLLIFVITIIRLSGHALTPHP
jgi:hypothetical protein